MQNRALIALAGWLVLLPGTACRSGSAVTNESRATGSAIGSPRETAPALPLDRIAIVGASVSAGFGGAPFGEAFVVGAPRSKIESEANVMLFRDPIGETQKQLAAATTFRATTIVGLDLLFWSLYGSTDPTWRDRARTSALAALQSARDAGAWIVIGDVPHVVTASEFLIPKEVVPSAAEVAAFNAAVTAWGAQERVVIVPFASWAEPLARDEVTEIAPGERVPARELVTADGLHPNAFGVWALLDRMDRYLETKLPGTPRDALVFRRPSPSL